MSINEAETWQELLKSIENFLIANQNQQYIFRGQGERTEQIFSTLYRKFYRGKKDQEDKKNKENKESNNVKLADIFPSLENILKEKQSNLLKEASSRFLPGENKVEVLAQLQHLGAITNFIDFTSDYLVALFFACSLFDAQAKTARPTLYFYRVDKDEFIEDDNTPSFEGIPDKNFIFRSRSQNNRIIAQRACFVHRERGILTKSERENIPKGFPQDKNDEKIFYLPIKAEWRQEILEYLEQRGISYRYLFNDLEGYVRYHSSYETLTVLKECVSAALDERNYAEAIKLLEEIVRYNQKEALEPISSFIDDWRNDSENLWESVKNFDNLIEEEERRTVFYLLRGLLDEREAEPKETINNYSKSIEKNESFYFPYFARGTLHLNQGNFYKDQYKSKEAQKKWKLALEDYNKTIELNPTYAYVYNNRGNLHKNQGDFYKEQNKLKEEAEKWKLALEDYNKAIELSPTYAYAYNNRGNLHSNQGDLYKEQDNREKAEEKWKLALEDYNKAIELNDADANVYNNRGNLHKSQGDFYKEQGNLEKAEEKWKLALEDYNKAIELNDADVNAHNNRGNLHKNQGDFYKEQNKLKEAQEEWKLALKDYNKAKKLHPDHYVIHYNLGEFYESLGDFYNEQGEREKAEENWDRAAADFNRALKLKPHFQLACDRLNALNIKRRNG